MEQSGESFSQCGNNNKLTSIIATIMHVNKGILELFVLKNID